MQTFFINRKISLKKHWTMWRGGRISFFALNFRTFLSNSIYKPEHYGELSISGLVKSSKNCRKTASIHKDKKSNSFERKSKQRGNGADSFRANRLWLPKNKLQPALFAKFDLWRYQRVSQYFHRVTRYIMKIVRKTLLEDTHMESLSFSANQISIISNQTQYFTFQNCWQVKIVDWIRDE